MSGILQEGTPFCKTSHLQKSGFFVDFCPITESGQRHPALSGRFCSADFPGFPSLIDAVEVLWQRTRRPTEADSLALCRCNALSLTLPDVGALVLRHKGKHLQNNVAHESAHQVFAAPGVQQWHIQHHNVDALCLGEQPPLL